MMPNYSNSNPNQNNTNKHDNAYRGFHVSMPKINIPRVDPKNFGTSNGNNSSNQNISSSVTTQGSAQGSIKRNN